MPLPSSLDKHQSRLGWHPIPIRGAITLFVWGPNTLFVWGPNTPVQAATPGCKGVGSGKDGPRNQFTKLRKTPWSQFELKSLDTCGCTHPPPSSCAVVVLTEVTNTLSITE
jgi:hypothetical protein